MYNFLKTEKKWQAEWEKSNLHQVDLENAKNPFYNLMMFPYPSAEGLHFGNVFAYIGSDIYGRYKKLNGYDVFEPMGFDAFGIHSENYAIKIGVHPAELIPKNIENFRENQLKKLGAIFDWNHQVDTTDPNYYKWTQWIFVQLFNGGLAYRKKSPVNWCPSCLTVLANEQVEGGSCERCKSIVEKKETEQWFFKITDYSEKLLNNLDWIDWSETTKTAQKRWIGKSNGAELLFKFENGESLIVYTTRPDTIFGATYMVIAPEHPILKKIVKDEYKEAVFAYVKEAERKTTIDRESLEKEKTGVFTGAYVINPATNQKIPVWISDYVLMAYGTGAIMAVPAHDQRDYDFAKKYQLPIIEVIKSETGIEKEAYTEEGIMVNSGNFNGLASEQAIEKITDWLVKEKGAERKTNYRLHDWCISRQRYWGPPIPIVYCEKCGIVAEKNLPVLLPEVEDFRPKGEGTSPLSKVADFVNTICPKCGLPAKRETDVMDNFLDSAWYFLRYPCTEFNDKAFDQERLDKWLPVDMYIGGNEHAVLHLMYTRFLTMALKDFGLLNFEEPFKKFRAHGIITKDGFKMSKSKGNVVNPDDYLNDYGADVLRMYIMFLGPYQEGGDFSDSGINGIKRFLEKVYSYYQEVNPNNQEDSALLNIVHKTIKEVTEDIEALKYNTAIAKIRILFNYITKEEIKNKTSLETFAILIAVFTPHLAEELWQMLGHNESIFKTKWPTYNQSLIREEKYEMIVQVNGKIRSKVEMDIDLDEKEMERIAFEQDNVKKNIEKKKIIKVITVKNKLVNIVVK